MLLHREDVARLIVGALNHQDLVKGKSFDCVSKAPGEGRVTKDFMQLFTAQPKWPAGQGQEAVRKRKLNDDSLEVQT